MTSQLLRDPRFATLALAALLALPVGCKWAPKEGKEDPLDLQDYPQITVLEKLHRRVMISEVKVTKGPPLAVNVTLRNREKEDERDIQYRFFWLDKNDVPQDENPDWHYLHMAARTYQYISGNALDDKYTHWRLEIRPAR